MQVLLPPPKADGFRAACFPSDVLSLARFLRNSPPLCAHVTVRLPLHLMLPSGLKRRLLRESYASNRRPHANQARSPHVRYLHVSNFFVHSWRPRQSVLHNTDPRFSSLRLPAPPDLHTSETVISLSIGQTVISLSIGPVTSWAPKPYRPVCCRSPRGQDSVGGVGC